MKKKKNINKDDFVLGIYSNYEKFFEPIFEVDHSKKNDIEIKTENKKKHKIDIENSKKTKKKII